nr:hypothetical protein [Bartonella queenslandensis]
MKSLSITRVVTFIAFFSLSALPTSASFVDKLTRMFTSVDTIEKYNKLYNEYANEAYIGSTHYEKRHKAEKYAHNNGYSGLFSQLDLVLHRHIYIIYCGRYVNLLRGEYNNVISQIDLPNVISILRRDYGWSEEDFMWTYSISNNSIDPMFYYAKKFIRTSKDGHNPEMQTTEIVSLMRDGHYEFIEQMVRFCKYDLKMIYTIMKPW